MTARQLRFGLVGAGAIAQTYVQAFARSTSAELVALAEVRPEVAKAVADQSGCEPFADYRIMAGASDLDAAVVCTPPSTHPDICVWLLEHGLHTLCEKPLAINFACAQRMLRASQRTECMLTLASKFRFVEDVVRAKAIVESGLLGDLVLFENSFTARVDMTDRWNSQAEISGGGVLIDNGTHSVDLIRYFLGPVAELQVVVGKSTQPIDVEDTVGMFVCSADGVMGSIDLSWSVNKHQPYYISIYGTHGTLLVGWKESKYRRSQDEEWTVFGNGYDKVAAFVRQIENFARAIQGREPLVVSQEDALASVEVIETAYRAIADSRWQPVG